VKEQADVRLVDEQSIVIMRCGAARDRRVYIPQYCLLDPS
jgi:hypothetical protein